MNFFLLNYLILTSQVIEVVTAAQWLIDTVSCNAAQQTAVANAMAGALAMAAAGDNMGANAANDPGQANLIQWLFGTMQAYNDVENHVLGPNFGVLSYSVQAASKNSLTPSDVIFYCSEVRIVPHATESGMWYDQDSKWVQNSPSDCSLGTLAYTNNPEDYPSQITICPWFLTYSLKTLFPTSKGLRSQLLGQLARFVIPIASRWVYTKIDAYSLFDKLLLHELTHTPKAVSNPTTDVGDRAGYGWKNCRALSTSDEANTNADSWALYGSASLLRQQGFAIAQDGSFTQT